MSMFIETQGVDWLEPEPHTPIFGDARPLRTREEISTYGDDRWILDHAVFENHFSQISVNFDLYSANWRPFAKRYTHMLINRPSGAPDSRRRFGDAASAVATIRYIQGPVREFLEFLTERGVNEIRDVTHADLDDYLTMLRASGEQVQWQRRRASEVLRLWDHRDLLAPPDRLPDAPPWMGRRLTELVGSDPNSGVNKTARIESETMRAVLAWALRFVELFAGDIVRAVEEHRALVAPRGGPGLGRNVRRPHRFLRAEVQAYVDSQRQLGRTLPGKDHDGIRHIDITHVARQLGRGRSYVAQQWVVRLLSESGLDVADYDSLHLPITAELDDAPWLPKPIGYSEVEYLADALIGACLVVVAYLSGMRPGEVLNLERDCVRYHAGSGMWTVTGRHFKTARSRKGEKIPEGEIRKVPWTVVEPVAHAIAVMESLHASELIFPERAITRSGQSSTVNDRAGLRSSSANKCIDKFTAWVNAYCQQTGRTDGIPPEEDGRALVMSRFRRTLAFHICRRPRGLVAASIQYGHVFTQMTVGYAGHLDSGFPDDYAFESMLARLDDLGELNEQLSAGSHVSGPAAVVLRERAAKAGNFGGISLVSAKQAKDLLANPDLQIIPGRGMHCVPDPAKALCRHRNDLPDQTRTPDLTDCKPACQNIARTDDDIDTLRQRSSLLRAALSNSLAPPLRLAREQAEYDRLEAIIGAHERSSHER